jgi:hypothetical protein
VTGAGSRLPWVALVVVALAVLVRAPVLGAGFVSDDYVLVAGIEGKSPLANTRYDLWSFYDGVPARQSRLVFDGGLPWWTAPTAAHAFFRPLASALLVAAHALFGRHAAGYYALLLGLCAYDATMAAVIFARLLSRRAATIALLLFAFHALHVDPTRWISTVHILLSAAAGLTGWWWTLRWREDGWKPGRYAAMVAFALALLAGEGGLGVLAYVACREIASPRSPGRAVAIATPALFGGVYVALYAAFHRGAHGIDGYLDPFASPGRFVAQFAGRLVREIPLLFTAPAEGALAGLGPAADAAAVPVLVAGGVVLVVLAYSFDRASLRACGWWAAASLLCAMPALLGPTDRALYAATLGSAAVLGILVAAAWKIVSGEAGASLLVRGLAAAGGSIVVLAHVGLGAFANLEGARAMAGISSGQLGDVASLKLASPQGTDLVVLSADGQTSGPWGGVLYAFATGSAPRSWQVLALGPQPHSVARIADDTIEIAPAGGSGFEMHLYRDVEANPMHAGDRIATRGLTIEVVDVTAEGRPTRIRVQADRSLDDPSFCFASRGREHLSRVQLPPVGTGVWLR